MNLYNYEMEKNVLGALILHGKPLARVNNIDIEIFESVINKEIFETIRDLTNKNKSIDISVLHSILNSKKEYVEVGSINYLMDLTMSMANVSKLDEYVEVLNEKLSNRKAFKVCNDIISKLVNGKAEKGQIIDEVDKLKSIMNNNDSITKMFVDASTVKRKKEKDEALKIGINKLDKITYGLPLGTVSILTGKPSSGKSTLINQIIASNLEEGENAYLYSGELPHNTLLEWFCSTVANKEHIQSYINKFGSEKFFVTDYGYDLISKWVKNRLFIHGEESSVNANSMIDLVEFMYLKKNVKLFIIDNLMTVDIAPDDYNKQKKFVNSLKAVAKKYGLVIILVAHPKKTEFEMNFVPNMYDVKGASEIANLVDYIYWTHRQKEKDNVTGEEEEKSYIYILKNRTNGNQDVRATLGFSKDRKRFFENESDLRKDYGYSKHLQFTQAELQNPFEG